MKNGQTSHSSLIRQRPLVLTLLLTSLLWLVSHQTGRAVDRAEIDEKLRALAVKLDVLQAKPDKRIPAEKLREAKGIILLDRIRAGFLFAYQGGTGMAMIKDPHTGKWSPPSFLRASESSIGAQIGGEQLFIVILLMNTNSVWMLTQPTSEFGAEASGTAGNNSAGVQSSASSVEPLFLVYTDKEGLYGGASVKAGRLAPDTEANVAYYGQALAAKEILFDHKVKPSEAATELAKKINQYAK